MSETTTGEPGNSLAWAWRSALLLFVLAGLTGVLFRVGLVYGWSGGLALENVRHAHSHLMYFGWGTSALMALIWRALPDRATAPWERPIRWVIAGTIGAAVIAYPLFLLYGYSSVRVGGAHLPIAVVGASLNMLVWYGFVGLYAAATRDLSRTPTLRLWDLAVLALVLSTFGVWSLALVQPLGLHSPMISTALTHVFLDLFSEGWFVLGVLGIAYVEVDEHRNDASEWPIWLVGMGLPLTFLLALPRSGLSTGLEWAGRLGGIVVAVCVLVLAIRLARRLTTKTHKWIWGVPLALLVLKAAAQLGGSVVPGIWLGGSHPLRIAYLHLMLLGFVSLGLVAGAQRAWRRNRPRTVALFQGAVGTVLVSLLLLFPGPWHGAGGHAIAAWTAILPVIAASGLLRRGQNSIGVATST